MRNKKKIVCLVLAGLLAFNPMQIRAEQYEDTYLSDELIQICETAEKVYGIDAQLLEALIETESSGNLRAVGKYGDCVGICQLNPKYMKSFAKNVIGNDPVDWYDPEIQIFTCCEYLNYLKDLLDAEGDVMLVLEGYNKGPENINGYGKYSKSITERAFEITMAQEQ